MAATQYIPVEKNELILMRDRMIEAATIIDKKLQGMDKTAAVSTPAPNKGMSIKERVRSRREAYYKKRK